MCCSQTIKYEELRQRSLKVTRWEQQLQQTGGNNTPGARRCALQLRAVPWCAAGPARNLSTWRAPQRPAGCWRAAAAAYAPGRGGAWQWAGRGAVRCLQGGMACHGAQPFTRIPPQAAAHSHAGKHMQAGRQAGTPMQPPTCSHSCGRPHAGRRICVCKPRPARTEEEPACCTDCRCEGEARARMHACTHTGTHMHRSAHLPPPHTHTSTKTHSLARTHACAHTLRSLCMMVGCR